MNNQLTRLTLRDLQNGVTIARAKRTEAVNAICDAKHSFKATPDTIGKLAVSRCEFEAQEALDNERKAKEALRVFCYRAKPAITRSGHAIRH